METATSCILRSPEGQGSDRSVRYVRASARRPKTTREGVAAERRCGPASKETGCRRRGFFERLACSERPHLAWRAAVLQVVSPSPRTRAHVWTFGFGRVEDPRCRGGKALEGQERPGEQRPVASGQLDAVVNGLGEGRKAPKQVKLAERDGSAERRLGRPGSGLRSAERESIVPGGTRQLRASVGVGETRGERRRAARLSTLVDDCKGAGGPERGRRSSRGESSEGRDPRDGSGMQQGRKARVC